MREPIKVRFRYRVGQTYTANLEPYGGTDSEVQAARIRVQSAFRAHIALEHLERSIGLAFAMTVSVLAGRLLEKYDTYAMMGLFFMIFLTLFWPHINYVRASSRATQAIEGAEDG